jgi:hypothetical protein
MRLLLREGSLRRLHGGNEESHAGRVAERLPRVGFRGREALVRRTQKHEDGHEPEPREGYSEHRGGVLLRSQQLASGAHPRPNVRPEFLLAFVRALIRNTTNGDLIALSIIAAKSETGASDEEVQVLADAIRNERPVCNRSDFFPDF